MAHLILEVSRGASNLSLSITAGSLSRRIGLSVTGRFALACLLSIAVMGIGAGSAMASPPANAFRFFHDADGRLKAAIDPEGETAVYNWDEAGNLSSISRASSTKLSIVQLSPSSGEVGQTIKIAGTGFSSKAESNTVKFNGTAATVVAATSWLLTVKVPEGATSGSVTVATEGEPVTSPEKFTVSTSAKPSISSISQTVAASGEEMTISGSNFESAAYENAVLLNGFRPELVSASTKEIKFKVPDERLGGKISVATSQGAAIGPDLFVPPAGTAASEVGTTVRISLGESKTVSLAGSEKVALVLFDGVAGEKVSLVASENTLSGTLSIWGPSGSQLTFGSFSGLTGPVTLPKTGTYTAMLEPSGGSAGSVKVASYGFKDITATINPPATAEGLKQPVSIEIPGQSARYSVEAKAGDKFSLRPAKANFTGSYYDIKWLDPSGSVVHSEVWNAKENDFWDSKTLSTEGTWTLLVDPRETSTGSVELEVWETPDATATINPPATAEGHKQSVSLAVPGQNARYSVEAKAGDKFSLRTSNSNMTGYYYIRWIKPDGSVFSSQLYGPKEDWFLDTKTFSTEGTWTLEVDPTDANTGSVDLLVWEAPDITGQSITPSEGGGSVTSTIGVPGQRELVSFSGTEGQRISWTTSENTISAGGTISIIKPDGSELSGSSGSFPFGESMALPTTGTYKFAIDPAATGGSPVTNGTGSLKLAAYAFKDLTATINPPATAEGHKQSVSITIPGQNARYSVEAKAGDKFSLRTSNSKITGYHYIRWIKPDGSFYHSQLLGPKEDWFVDTQTFPTEGTWMLLVDPLEASTGSVDLLVWEAPDITGQSITPSEGGGSVTSTISVPGQRELITFSGTASQLVTVKAQESTIASGQMWVLKPDGSELSGSKVSFSSSSSGRAEVTLPTTGTYTIVVDPPATGSSPVTNGTGSAQVTVYLGSHVAWRGGGLYEPQLVSLLSPDWPSDGVVPLSYSDIPSGHLVSSASGPRDEEGPRREEGNNRWSTSHPPAAQQHARLSVAQRRPARSESSKPSLPHRWRPNRRGAWLPPKPDRERNWLVGSSSSPWIDLPPLEATADSTALAGQVLRVDGLPLAGVSVSIEGTSSQAKTGRAGRFLIEDLPAGHQELVVNGEGRDGRRYGTYEIGVDLEAEETTVLDYTVWLTPLDRAGDLQVSFPTARRASLKTPRVPGLEVEMAAGTRIIDDSGRAVRDLNITAIPLDRPPFPLPPFVTVPVYFTVQPGGASLSKGARFVYPNWGKLAPGERVDFWNYDPEDRGWYVYGRGTVTDDGTQVVPDPGVRVWEFTGAMAVSGPTPPPKGPPPKGPKSGDPVDLYTGLFTYEHSDLVLPDTIPISITRTYRTDDSNTYSFGEGMTNAYDLRLWPVVNYKEADLILPDGGRVHYVRTSPGTGSIDAVYEPTSEAGMFDGSVITWNGSDSNWDMALTSGITLKFGGFFASLLSVRDRFGNTLTIKRKAGPTSPVEKVISPNGRWAKFSYEAGLVTEIADNGGRKFKYTYTSNRLTKVDAPGGRTTEYEYDESGRMKGVVNARGNKYLQNEYDANGRVKKQTAGDGGTFEFAYELDESGKKVKATTITDPLGNQRKVVFNAEGFMTSETEAPETELAQTTSFEPQAATGRILSETDPLSRKTTFKYDSSGNVTELTRMAGTGEANTTKFAYEPGTNWITEEADPLGHTTKYQYGSEGQLLNLTDALGHETSFEYNTEGQRTEVTNPEGETTKFSYDGGDLVGVTNPLGNTMSRFVDTLGRVRRITLPGGERYLYAYNESDELASVTTPLGAKTTIEYDADGNPKTIVDPRGGKTAIAYDVMDRIEKETDPLEKTTEWDYNKAGDLTEAVDRRGKVSKLSYDKLRRLTGVSFGVSGKTSESSIGYEYDEASRLTDVNDSAAGEYTIGYDNFDQLASVEGPNGNVDYEYDDAGRRELMEVPGRTVDYEYDDANRLTELASGGQTVLLEYDKVNRLENLRLPNGIEQLYGYDEAGQGTSIAYKDGESTLGEINYSYDANGRTEAMWGSYARIGLPEALKSTKYNAANALVEREGKKLTYDAAGNLTGDGSDEYTWNARGQLTKISGINTASFGYDPFGRRTSKTLGGTTTKLLFDGPNVVQESIEGKVTADLLTGPAADEVFSRTTKSGTSSYLTNALNSTIALANGSAEVKTTYTYDPFGGMTKAGEATDNPYQFTGRENDGTGLQYNRARYYSPLTGRFISQDPAGFEGSGANLYWYGYGNPIDLTDPSGESSLGTSDPSQWCPYCDAKVGDWSGNSRGVSSGPRLPRLSLPRLPLGPCPYCRGKLGTPSGSPPGPPPGPPGPPPGPPGPPPGPPPPPPDSTGKPDVECAMGIVEFVEDMEPGLSTPELVKRAAERALSGSKGIGACFD
jgi:RHS repeat-associated protein